MPSISSTRIGTQVAVLAVVVLHWRGASGSLFTHSPFLVLPLSHFTIGDSLIALHLSLPLSLHILLLCRRSKSILVSFEATPFM